MSRFPSFLHKNFEEPKSYNKIKDLVFRNKLNTVCSSAKCPNLCECFNRGSATFLILGSVCTRTCRFCGVSKGMPEPVDNDEPMRLSHVVKEMGLSYVVLTSVTRDDLPDGGAAHFVECIKQCRAMNSSLKIEVLIPDLKGDEASLKTILDSSPDVLNHNIETVPRLYCELRPQADFMRSVSVLEFAARQSSGIITKSGIMVGLGETVDEVEDVMRKLAAVGCQILTIGQYLPPARNSYPAHEYVSPAIYEKYKETGERLGIKRVIAGPFVRSSYKAEAAFIK